MERSMVWFLLRLLAVPRFTKLCVYFYAHFREQGMAARVIEKTLNYERIH